MSHIHRYRHVIRVLVVFASTLLGLAISAPAAFAIRVDESGGSPLPFPTGKAPTYTLPNPVVTGAGMPGWQLLVIVAGAALIAAMIAVVAHRVRTAHRARLVPAA